MTTRDDSHSLLLVGTVFAVGFTLGVGAVICFNPFSGGFEGLASGRFGTGIAGHAIGRYLRGSLENDVTVGSEDGGSTQFDLGVPGGPSLDPDDWRREVASCRCAWCSSRQRAVISHTRSIN